MSYRQEIEKRGPMCFYLLILCATALSQIYALSSSEEIFTHIYDNKLWGQNEQGEGFSGSGSTLKETTMYRNFLQNFLNTHKIKSVVDLGCGDWTFSKEINWSQIDYIGIDVVKSVIQKNVKLFETPSIRFIHADGLSSTLPSADLLICKDVLQHLPNKEIIEIMKQFGNFKYCLITNDIDLDCPSNNNTDIKTGECRALNLMAPPFSVAGSPIFIYRGWPDLFTKQVLLIKN